MRLEPPPRVHVSPDRLDLPGELARIDLVIPPGAEHLRLDISLFHGADPTGPGGWLGSWSLPVEGLSKVSISLDPGAAPEARVRIEPGVFAKTRIPSAGRGDVPDFVDVHVVLKDPETGHLLVDTVVPWLRSREALERSRERQASLIEAPAYVRALGAAPRLSAGACVHVVAQDIRPGDAVGNLAIDVSRWLRERGVRVQLWARHFDGFAAGLIHEVADLPAQADAHDLVFYQHSIGDPYLEAVLATPCAKLCFYQGITPPEMLEAWDPHTADNCRWGLAQLPRLAGFDGLLAASSFTAGQLRDAVGDAPAAAGLRLCPPALNLARFGETPAERVPLPDGRRFLLYVGRFAPHKRILELVDAFAAYERLDPACDLVLAGFSAGTYGLEVKRRIEACAAGRVHLFERPGDGQLKTLYQTCTAYVSMSGHEGFGIPPVEAMGFGKPVLAYAAPGIGGTLGGAGLFDQTEPREIAEAWHGALGDAGASERLVAAQGERLRALRKEADGSVLREAMESAYAARR